MSNIVSTAVTIGLWVLALASIIILLPVVPLPPEIAASVALLTYYVSAFSYVVAVAQLWTVIKLAFLYEIVCYGLIGLMWIYKRLLKTGSN